MNYELVLVVPTADVVAELGDGRPWNGIRSGGEAALHDLINRRGEFRPRSAMEQDPTWKQVIPYPVLRDGEAWFLMRRTTAGGDARLHDRYSLGVGGHVNPEDRADRPDLRDALVREWHEELIAAFVPELEFVGLLNDDSTPVGAVHLGAVYVGDAAGRAVAIRETHKLTGEFASTEAVADVADRLETWSRIVFDHLRASVAAGGMP